MSERAALAFHIPKVRAAPDADDLAVKVHLFLGDADEICGWYIGPVAMTVEGVRLPYLPRSKKTRAALAVVRAIEESRARHIGLCLVDPDDLWEAAWRAA